jgi:hypothetical protein
VNLTRLVVTNRQESRARGVLQRLAANHDLVVCLDDLSLFVVLSRNRRCGTGESDEKGERYASHPARDSSASRPCRLQRRGHRWAPGPGLVQDCRAVALRPGPRS